MQLFEQDHLRFIWLSLLWDETLGDSNICVAVLDGPIDRSHLCFNGAKLNYIETKVSDIPSSGVAFGEGFIDNKRDKWTNNQTKSEKSGLTSSAIAIDTKAQTGSIKVFALIERMLTI